MGTGDQGRKKGKKKKWERDAAAEMSSCFFPSTAAASTSAASLRLRRTLIPILILSLLRVSSALLRLRGDNFSYTFLDVPARFAAPIDGSGICGSLHVADPIYACSPLRNGNATAAAAAGGKEPVRFLLAERGDCSFQTKVWNAQDAGFQTVVVFDNSDKNSLISMIGDSEGIWIHAVFVSKIAGETLKKYARGEEGECCLGPSTDETAGTALIISLISLVIVVSVLATFFFARNFRRLQHASRNRPKNISRQEVEDLPCIKYKTFSQSKHMSDTCAICLEEYRDGEMLRVLPCQHEFHLHCVDSWLTKWGTSCPVCKHDLSSKR